MTDIDDARAAVRRELDDEHTLIPGFLHAAVETLLAATAPPSDARIQVARETLYRAENHYPSIEAMTAVLEAAVLEAVRGAS